MKDSQFEYFAQYQDVKHKTTTQQCNFVNCAVAVVNVASYHGKHKSSEGVGLSDFRKGSFPFLNSVKRLGKGMRKVLN